MQVPRSISFLALAMIRYPKMLRMGMGSWAKLTLLLEDRVMHTWASSI